ncbi:tetratricopeptide repeat protein [Acinetobacter oleivorans]|uniref:tetratricopeptide repeat protein n=1 Tax=Acinetobacter oleivorans TaxID=1148157 RepID=UPI000DCF8695|nr:tetratricopeptide repeat protein [Acinetobacter oleivorans]
MKKLLIASLITLSSASIFAADSTTTAAKTDVFKQAEQLYAAKNYSAAFQEMQRLAQTGNAQAIYNLGYMTQMGQGTAKDSSKALKYYEDASNKGYAQASYTLAQIYETGELGVAKDSNKFSQYIQKASAQGSDDATVKIATILFAQKKPQSHQIALQKLAPLIRKGNYPATQVKALYDISQGVENKNPLMKRQGIEALQSIAQKGYAPASMALATMMANGNIIPQNLPEAKKIFTELANQNVPNAKESLASVDKIIAEKNKQAANAPAQPAPKK